MRKGTTRGRAPIPIDPAPLDPGSTRCSGLAIPPLRPTAASPGGASALGQEIPWGVARICGGSCTSTGSGIHVYVLDTGIDADHPDLAGLGNGYAAVACRGGGCKTAWDDDQGHGTHVAGTIDARNNGIGVVGVAVAVTLHAVKVLDKSGSGSFSRIIAGID